MLKTLELRDPRAKTFDPANVVDSSFIQELDKSGFIDAVWKRWPAMNIRGTYRAPVRQDDKSTMLGRVSALGLNK